MHYCQLEVPAFEAADIGDDIIISGDYQLTLADEWSQSDHTRQEQTTHRLGRWLSTLT